VWWGDVVTLLFESSSEVEKTGQDDSEVSEEDGPSNIHSEALLLRVTL
jgi:hypothetical protein